MGKREDLLCELREIKQNQFELKVNQKAYDYAKIMLEYIGDPDPELRDKLIYQTFYQWILVKEYFSKDELHQILFIAKDQKHLFFQLGNEGDDSVFTRTFSVLVIALILAYHRQYLLIDHDLFVIIKENLIQYYSKENDLRAYVEGNGWADGVSHGADALDELVACKESDAKICSEVLEVIKKMLTNGRYAFCEEEEERITSVVFRIINNNLIPKNDINKWIERLIERCQIETNRSTRRTRINVKNFIRSLYFRLKHSKKDSTLITTLINAEADLNSFHV